MSDVDFPFFKGQVGRRDKDGVIELAYFGVPPEGRPPFDGKLEGQRVRVTSVMVRDLGQPGASLARSNAVRVVTLIVNLR